MATRDTDEWFWGEDSAQSKEEVEESIFSYVENELNNQKLDTVEHDGKTYRIRLSVELVEET
jgi:hypothetical protein